MQPCCQRRAKVTKEERSASIPNSFSEIGTPLSKSCSNANLQETWGMHNPLSPVHRLLPPLVYNRFQPCTRPCMRHRAARLRLSQIFPRAFSAGQAGGIRNALGDGLPTTPKACRTGVVGIFLLPRCSLLYACSSSRVCLRIQWCNSLFRSV